MIDRGLARANKPDLRKWIDAMPINKSRKKQPEKRGESGGGIERRTYALPRFRRVQQSMSRETTIWQQERKAKRLEYRDSVA